MQLHLRISTWFAIVLLASSLQLTAQRPGAIRADSSSQPPVVSTYAGNGVRGYSGDGGVATGGSLYLPSGVAFDAAGNLYIADTFNHVVRKVAKSTGVISTVAGGGECPAIGGTTTGGYCGDGGPATSAGLYYPSGVALDAAGDLYIADTGNDMIRRVDAKTGVISRVAGSYSCTGTTTMVCSGNAGYAGDGGAATSAELDGPLALLVDSSGNLYVADYGSNAIRFISASSGDISTVAGSGAGCGQQTDQFGDGCPATQASLAGPTAVALDASGDLFISDTYGEGKTMLPGGGILGPGSPGHYAVRRVDATTHVITTYAGAGSGCAGQVDLLGDGCPATSALFGFPAGLAFDGSGNLYVADQQALAGDSYPQSTIRMISASTGTISIVAGNGTDGYSGNGGAPTSAEFYEPFGIAFDPSGNLYIADEFNYVIREVTYNASQPAVATPLSPLQAEPTLPISL